MNIEIIETGDLEHFPATTHGHSTHGLIAAAGGFADGSLVWSNGVYLASQESFEKWSAYLDGIWAEAADNMESLIAELDGLK